MINKDYAEYKDYLKSQEWLDLKLDLLMERGCKCEKCGEENSPDKLYIHHKTYKRLYEELSCDLEVLCNRCHFEEHFPYLFSKNAKTVKYFFDATKTKQEQYEDIVWIWRLKFVRHIDLYAQGEIDKGYVLRMMWSLNDAYYSRCKRASIESEFNILKETKKFWDIIQFGRFDKERRLREISERIV